MNGIKVTLPTTPLELATTIAIAILFLYATIKLISGFTTMMAISNYSMGNYEYNIEELRIFLEVNIFMQKLLQTGLLSSTIDSLKINL